MLKTWVLSGIALAATAIVVMGQTAPTSQPVAPAQPGTDAAPPAETAIRAPIAPLAPLAANPSQTASAPTAATQPTTSGEATPEPADVLPSPTASSPAWLIGKPLSFDALSFDVGLDADWRRRRTSSRAGRLVADRYEQKDEYRRIQETVGWRGDGAIFGDRVARYQFSGRWGLSQERYEESRPYRDLSESPHGTLLEYDARINLLPAGKISGNAWASQLDDRVPRPFLASLDRRRERYGADLQFNDRVLPMRLSFEDSFENLSSQGFRLNDDEERHDKTLRYEATWQPSEHHSLRLDYEYDDRREQYSGTATKFDTTRNYLTLDHVISFGKDDRSRLETIGRFQDESGDLARDVYEVAPRLRLQHTDSLATNYGVQYLRESYDGIGFEIYRGDAGVTHTLGDALITSASLYALQQQIERGGDTGEWGGTGGVAFNKENSHGRFSTNLNYTHSVVRNDDYGYDGIVIGESLTLRDPLPAFLTHQYVRPLTVVITDADRRRTYLPGRDYFVLRIGRYTAVTRVATGNIRDGETVLATYTYDTARGLELNRDRIDVRVQEAFKSGWTPYYAGTRQFETVDRERFLTYAPRDVSRHRLGLTYRKTSWSAGAEYEYNDDSIDPYQALHLNGDATLWQKAPHTLNARMQLSYFDFDGRGQSSGVQASYFDFGALPRLSIQQESRQDTLLDLGLTYNCVLASHFDAAVTALYRFEDDSLRGRTDGVDLSASLNWRLGLFSAIFEVEYNLLDLPGSQDRDFAAWIKLRREFPVIGGMKR